MQETEICCIEVTSFL